MTSNLFTLNEVLIGALDADRDPDDALATLAARGIDPARVALLRQPSDLQALRGTGCAKGWRARLQGLMRVLDDLDERGAGQVLAGAAADLDGGRTVVVVHHVPGNAAAATAQGLRDCGMARPRYLGRWSVLEGGAIPAAGGAPTR